MRTKNAYLSCQSGKLLVKFEDVKWVIRSRKSKKDRQHNGQKKER